MPITSIVSINQLITWFQNFQENHYFLKDFGFGEPYDIGTSRQMTFPYMWVTMNEDSSIGTAANNKTAIPEISFSIMFMDKINIQENYLDTNGFPSDNSQEILSDTLQCLQDLIVMIQQNWNQYGVIISQDVSFYPAVDETTDKATGVVARIVLKTRQVNCVIPEAPTTIVVQPQQATYATLLTCETLIDCPTFQTYAYTGGTYNSGTTELTITSLNGHSFSISGITGGGGGGSGTSGTSGSSGVSGANGSSGTSGSSGANGQNGTSGTSGVSGSSGSSGANGQNGTSGTSGGDGSSGTSGANGTSGTSGGQGLPGSSGTNGSSGSSGAAGASQVGLFQYTFWDNPGFPASTDQIRINNANYTLATQISVYFQTSNSINLTTFYNTLVSHIGNVGYLLISDSTGLQYFYQITSVVSVGGGSSFTLNVTYIGRSAAGSYANGTTLYLTFELDGNNGTSGTSGASGTSGTSGANGDTGTSGSSGVSGTSGTSATGAAGTSGTSGTSPANPITQDPASPTTITYLWSGTQAQYNALTPNANTIYFIV